MRSLAVAAIVSILGLAACGGGKSGASKAPPSNATAQGSQASVATAENGSSSSVDVSSSPAPGAPPFEVLSSTDNLASNDSYEIYGEVRNNTNQAAGEITVHVTLFDSNKKPVAQSTTETTGMRNMTPAGERTPFYFSFADGKKLKAKVGSYQLTADGEPTDKQPVQGLVVSGEKVTTTPKGGYSLAGRLTNTSGSTITSPELVATFYDPAGKVVRVGQAVFQESAFAPQQGDDFTFPYSDLGKATIVKYVLVPQTGE